MTKTKTDLTVPNEICRQIGARAFMMLGANKKNSKFGDDKSLTFKIGRNSKKVQYIKVELTSMDVYKVTFSRMGGKHRMDYIIISEIDGVYCENLCRIIEQETGLYTSL